MNTKQIDYCIELARTLNFSRAAENLFVSQPTFSYQIRLLEEEVGFAIFERSGRGAALTPAGAQFTAFLTGMRQDLKRAVEQGQNFSARYKDSISICMMVRQALYFLPEAMRLFGKTHPHVQILPVFRYEHSAEVFFRSDADILFALKENARQIPGIQVHDLFESRIYLIADRDDPLSARDLVTEEDLYGRTLMVGGGSPPEGRPAPSDRLGENKLLQQSGPRHHPDQRSGRQGHLPGPGLFKRPQRPVRLDPLRLPRKLLLRAADP